MEVTIKSFQKAVRQSSYPCLSNTGPVLKYLAEKLPDVYDRLKDTSAAVIWEGIGEEIGYHYCKEEEFNTDCEKLTLLTKAESLVFDCPAPNAPGCPCKTEQFRWGVNLLDKFLSQFDEPAWIVTGHFDYVGSLNVKDIEDKYNLMPNYNDVFVEWDGIESLRISYCNGYNTKTLWLLKLNATEKLAYVTWKRTSYPTTSNPAVRVRMTPDALLEATTALIEARKVRGMHAVDNEILEPLHYNETVKYLEELDYLTLSGAEQEAFVKMAGDWRLSVKSLIDAVTLL